MKTKVEPVQKTQRSIRELLTGNSKNLKKMFINKMSLQFTTIKRAFKELDRNCQGHITFDQFKTIIQDWGFESKDSQIRSLFDWIDNDKDQKISFLDLKHSLGLEILP